MTALVLVEAGVIGLVIGSFLNVVVYRVPLGLSVVQPRSACPGCATPIAARDNVPLLSWVLLRGRCRQCAEPISARYPLVEALTSALFVLAALPSAIALDGALTATPQVLVADVLVLLAFLYLAAISIALAAIDLDVHRLPDALVLPGYAVGAALFLAADLLRGDLVSIGTAAAGAGAAVLLYAVLWFVKPGGMGLGDVKLAGVLGLFLGQLGVAQLTVGIAAGFLLGGVFGVVLIAIGRAKRGTGIPFGPWMLAGAWVGVAAGAPLADGYLRLVGLT
ncbi:prepilin peptidase [uncultured Amnibacterium sp.]|uniref:prepilin peptidase n=1 Tax=uncultured Amnibacterium sp. TaxID=1631851 RepID=UPI0035CC7C0D